MIGYPIDSFLAYEDDGTPIYDRAVTSAQLRKLYKTLYSNGVLPDAPASEQLLTTASEGMTVIVKAGFCIVNGLLKWIEEDKTLQFQASEDQDRIDRVVVRFNDTDEVRDCELMVIKGTKANNPAPPALTRTESIYDICLADVFISANSYTITTDKITDNRLDPELCGIISPLGEFDTEQLYNQIQADLSFFRNDKETEINNWFEEQQEAFIGWSEEEKAIFLAWFDHMKDQLDEDAAGHLQMEIDEITTDTEEIHQEVNQINSDLYEDGGLIDTVESLMDSDKTVIINGNFQYCTYNIEVYVGWSSTTPAYRKTARFNGLTNIIKYSDGTALATTTLNSSICAYNQLSFAYSGGKVVIDLPPTKSYNNINVLPICATKGNPLNIISDSLILANDSETINLNGIIQARYKSNPEKNLYFDTDSSGIKEYIIHDSIDDVTYIVLYKNNGSIAKFSSDNIDPGTSESVTIIITCEINCKSNIPYPFPITERTL